MATSGTKRGKAIRRLLWVMVAVMIVLALLPAWFPWLLRPLLNHYALGFAGYNRIGYTRYALDGVRGEWGNARLEAKRVEGALPTLWLWRRIIGGTNISPFLSISGGDLMFAPQTSVTNQTGSLDETLNQTFQIAALLQRVLPMAELTNCRIQVSSNLVLLPHAVWQDRQLHALVGLPESRGEIKLVGRFEGSSSLRLSAAWEAYDAAVLGEFSKTSAGWRWEGKANWLTNQAEISAQFPTNGWWPVQAQLKCPELSVPAQLLHLERYEKLTATLAANLSSNQFSLQATGFAWPSHDPAASGFPGVDFSLAVGGDFNSITLRSFEIQSPGLRAQLSSPVGMTWNGELLANSARLEWVMDLSQVPGAALTGRAEGSVSVEPHGQQPPTAQVSFSAADVQAWGVKVQNLLVKGEVAPPEFRLGEFTADLADGSKLAAGGSFDFKTREIANGNWKCSGGFLEKFLPGLRYNGLAASGQLHGPLTNCSHSGEVAIKGFHGDWLKALDVGAKWNGHNLQLDSVGVNLTAGESILSVGGAFDLSTLRESKASATLTNVTLRRGKEDSYALQHSCAISFSAAGTNAGRGNWMLGVDGFDWQGTNRKVSLTAHCSWPGSGNVKAAMTNVALADFSDFLTADIPNLSLAVLNVAAHWSNGPVHSAMLVAGALTNRAGQSFTLQAALATDETLSVSHLSVQNPQALTLSVTGNIPVKIIPGREGGWLDWDKSRAIALTGNGEDQQSQPLSLPLAALGELNVAKPELHFQISGTLKEPSASLKAAAAMITWVSPTNNSLRPKLEHLQLSAEVHPDRIKLDAFNAMLDGQSVEAAGEWPLSAGAWKTMWSERKLPDWSPAHGRLQLAGAQMAALSRYLPEFLSPEGQLSAMLELKTGKQLDGALRLTNAATRALGQLTPVRDITASVRLEGQRATLEEFHGQIGGQPVLADGFVTLQNREWQDYQVHLQATNVPLARSLELLLRGDFDLHLRGGGDVPPMVSGAVHLHDGLYLQHASALVWSGPKRPQLRPPYFSVTNEPLADWKLDLVVSGDRFLRVRTPVFSGLLSANLKLKGSLRAPVLTGDVNANSGRVLFPFGSLTLNQGYASFSGNDPLGPELQLSASGRNYRYELRVEVKGPTEVAKVTFSSTPPLTSEQILLMLTAGELPQMDYAFSSGARAGRLAMFAGNDLISRFLGNEGAEERLIIRTGESISQEGRLTYSVEYKLTDRWSLIGEYDEFNAFNTDLKWKIFAR